MVVYEDGNCESLDSALESRKAEKHREERKADFVMDNLQVGNGLFSYVRKDKNQNTFCYTLLNEFTLQPIGNLKVVKLERLGQDVELRAVAAIYNDKKIQELSLITLWSDKRMFKEELRPADEFPSIGALHTLVHEINANHLLAMIPINQDCVAIYAARNADDGASVILYNTKFKIVQSKVPFKVYLTNFQLWNVNKNILLAIGGHLSVIPYLISADLLSNMIGSQCDNQDIRARVENEMINEDLNYEMCLDYDSDQEPVEGFEFAAKLNYNDRFTRLASKAKPVVGADEVKSMLDKLYRDELVVELFRKDDQEPGTAGLKILSNVDETVPLFDNNFELLCSDLERYGCSEIEITNKVLPTLVRANRTKDIGLMLKRYNHVSEKMLVKVIKYLLSCPEKNDAVVKVEPVANGNASVDEFDKSQLYKDKKFPNSNVLLNTKQSETRDCLSIAICCSFDSQSILKFLRNDLTISEMIALMDHLYKILSTSSLDEQYDMRGNLVEGDEFDLDGKLFEWFKVLLDSHYQQILLSKDDELINKLEQWLELVNNHIIVLNEMNDMRPLLEKLSTKKPIHASKKCSSWYTIEDLQLY